MTRFARAKGSKSSNERAPEDSTPWELMKEQLLQAKKQTEEAKKREEAEKQRIENYENFLKEHKSQKRKATWCDFPEAEKPKSVDIASQPPSKKKKKNKQKKPEQISPVPQSSETPTEINVQNAPSKKSKKKKQKKTKSNELSPLETSKQENSTEQPNPTVAPVEGTTITSKKKKNKQQKKNNLQEALPGAQLQNGNDCDQLEVPSKIKKNKKQKFTSNDKSQENGNNNVDKSANQISNQKQNNVRQKQSRKDKKLVGGMPVRRKPVDDRSFQLIINGKDVELVRFDGFPIMKRDAERLEELKNNMIKKGIPKSEVNRTLKLERRRAEKALARMKKDVCYNCRKGGHNLSDCPDLKTKIPGVGAADGVCFKCGSTEHKQFECKVQKDKEFRFATCFICKEPGHIARQCPDNPKGLYPNGGGCKLCGDVTHLRKDCPTTSDKREETSIKLQTLDSTDTIEGIEQKTTITPMETTKKPKKIKF